MAAQLGSGVSRALAVGAIGLALLLVLASSWGPLRAETDKQDADTSDDSAAIDPLGPNAACYVCHMTFVREELSKVHLPKKVTCIECHGLSAGHANDEDIGATPPDVTFKRNQVDASCTKCHEHHDVPARQVVARWLERGRTGPSPVCTDCHGTHRIERSEQTEPDDANPKPAEPQ